MTASNYSTTQSAKQGLDLAETRCGPLALIEGRTSGKGGGAPAKAGAPAAVLPPSANRGVDNISGNDVTTESAGVYAPHMHVDKGQAYKPCSCNLSGDLIGEGIDWLTVTVGDPEALAELLRKTSLKEAGKGLRGFEASERRLCYGGECWRRYRPFTASQTWGRDYECWEWESELADSAAWQLRGLQVRPSRVDLAWDYSINERITADSWYRHIRRHAKEQGISLGVAGQGGVNTRYVGSSSSSRRIRCYRKDLQNDLVKAQFGPVLRVELILRDEYAQQFWSEWSKGSEFAYQLGAAHIRAMTGFLCRPGEVGVIGPLHVRGSDELGTLLALRRQYGEFLAVCLEAGIPDKELLQLLATATSSRLARSRRKSRVAGLLKDGISTFLSTARALISAGEPVRISE